MALCVSVQEVEEHQGITRLAEAVSDFKRNYYAVR